MPSPTGLLRRSFIVAHSRNAASTRKVTVPDPEENIAGGCRKSRRGGAETVTGDDHVVVITVGIIFSRHDRRCRNWERYLGKERRRSTIAQCRRLVPQTGAAEVVKSRRPPKVSIARKAGHEGCRLRRRGSERRPRRRFRSVAGWYGRSRLVPSRNKVIEASSSYFQISTPQCSVPVYRHNPC